MVARLVRAVMTTLRGIGAAVRARPGTALAVVGGVLALHVFLPPLVLTSNPHALDLLRLQSVARAAAGLSGLQRAARAEARLSLPGRALLVHRGRSVRVPG